MVFGDAGAGEYGTYYIAYAADPAVTEQMLTNMFVGKPAGNYDRILDVSTAVTGTLFFVPSLDLLESLADDAIPVTGRRHHRRAGPSTRSGTQHRRWIVAIGSLRGEIQ